MKKQRYLTAPGQGIRTVRQVAELGGFKNPGTVYARVAKGEPIDGVQWRWYDEEDRDLSDNVAAPTVEPLRKRIICLCAECNGKVWRPGDIHTAFPELRGMQLWKNSFKKVNEISGHQFGYETVKPSENWKRRSDDVAMVPATMTPELPRRVPNTSEEALSVLPYNPFGPSARFAALGVKCEGC